jgi:hypothetical protein
MLCRSVAAAATVSATARNAMRRRGGALSGHRARRPQRAVAHPSREAGAEGADGEGKIRALFAIADADGDGVVSAAEFGQLLSTLRSGAPVRACPCRRRRRHAAPHRAVAEGAAAAACRWSRPSSRGCCCGWARVPARL